MPASTTMRQQILQSLNSPPQILRPPAASPSPDLLHFRGARAAAASSPGETSLSPLSSSSSPPSGLSTPGPPKNPPGEADSSATIVDCSSQPAITKKAFVDISIDGAPAGSIVVGLYGDAAPLGATRFATLVAGAAGISYLRKEFTRIVPGYIQHGGVSPTASTLGRSDGGCHGRGVGGGEGEVPGDEERGRGCGAGDQGPDKPLPKLKLVAKQGKLVIDEEEVRPDPNGTEFVIAVKDSPELDASTLAVGRVLEGMDAVGKVAGVLRVT